MFRSGSGCDARWLLHAFDGPDESGELAGDSGECLVLRLTGVGEAVVVRVQSLLGTPGALARLLTRRVARVGTAHAARISKDRRRTLSAFLANPQAAGRDRDDWWRCRRSSPDEAMLTTLVNSLLGAGSHHGGPDVSCGDAGIPWVQSGVGLYDRCSPHRFVPCPTRARHRSPPTLGKTSVSSRERGPG